MSFIFPLQTHVLTLTYKCFYSLQLFSYKWDTGEAWPGCCPEKTLQGCQGHRQRGWIDCQELSDGKIREQSPYCTPGEGCLTYLIHSIRISVKLILLYWGSKGRGGLCVTETLKPSQANIGLLRNQVSHGKVTLWSTVIHLCFHLLCVFKLKWTYQFIFRQFTINALIWCLTSSQIRPKLKLKLKYINHFISEPIIWHCAAINWIG